MEKAFGLGLGILGMLAPGAADDPVQDKPSIMAPVPQRKPPPPVGPVDAPPPKPKGDPLDSLTPEQWLWLLKNKPWLFDLGQEEVGA